jgi:hypothetical protein
VFGKWPRCRRLSKTFFRECWWFSNFSILCRRYWWKLLVCLKTSIYCGQRCSNAVSYSNVPLLMHIWTHKCMFLLFQANYLPSWNSHLYFFFHLQ